MSRYTAAAKSNDWDVASVCDMTLLSTWNQWGYVISLPSMYCKCGSHTDTYFNLWSRSALIILVWGDGGGFESTAGSSLLFTSVRKPALWTARTTVMTARCCRRMLRHR